MELKRARQFHSAALGASSNCTNMELKRDRVKSTILKALLLIAPIWN